MRKCASCGRDLGAAFATSPICPCCDGPIAGGARRRSPNAPPPEVFPSLEETFGRIVARATEAALAAPPAGASATAPPDDRATYVTPSGSLPPVPADATLSGTLQMSSKDFASKSGEILTQAAADIAAQQNPEAAAQPPASSTSPSPASPSPTSPSPNDPPAFNTVQLDRPPAAPTAPIAAQPKSGTVDGALGKTDAREPTPTHLLHTQTFSTPLIPPDGSNLPGSLGGAAAGIPPADLQRMSQLWSGTVAGSAHERMTMVAGAGVEEIPSLMVGRRVLQAISGGRAADADYQLLDMIGEGGIGVVYAARQASIDRTVAVKMLKSDKTTDQHQRAKFLSEAVITGELDHPNIVPIYDLGASQQGSYFYSMKRVVGTPWNKVIQTKTLAENIEILMKVADAVAFAHSRSVVHRDLKPENVMLGSYGEVLLMDWGLALLTGESRKITVANYDPGMGGTPAYMSPEMATGPLAAIDARSDVYLLGAILFEMVVGRPPHTGPNVMGCLFAAARNEIVPTDHEGELIKIARRSMASSREERYGSVKDFQAAIREYQSHAESILLAVQAQEDLTRAAGTADYQDFARALFGFQQALGLWSGSEQAIAGIRATKVAYAEAAIKKADFDLALSLLDVGDSRDDELRKKAQAGRVEREQRQQRLTAAKRMAVGLAALVVVVVTGAFFQISSALKEARTGREAAEIAQNQALESADRATKANKIADDRLVEVTAAVRQATESAAAEKKSAADALAAAKTAAEEQKKAEEATKQAKIATEDKAYEAYIASIGLAAAKIEENSFGTARDILNGCEPQRRRWEWGRLMYLCGTNIPTFRTQGPIDGIAVSPDGNRVAVASWDHCVHVWTLDDSAPTVVVPYESKYIHAVAFSPDGEDVAIGGGDPKGFVQIRNIATGVVKQTFAGHTDNVLGVSYSRDGKRLLTCSFDKTVRLWDVKSKEQLQRFDGHSWWVWSAKFAPPPAPGQPENRCVSAGQDGTVIVWDIEKGTAGEPFTGHKAPVYSAVFSPDGKYVVTAGADNRVLLWDPADIRPVDYRKVIADQPQAPLKYTALGGPGNRVGHSAAVRSVAFSADGKRIVSAGNDNTIKVWNAQDLTLEKTLRGHAGWIRACTFTPDGRSIVSGSHDRRVMHWDFANYSEEKVLGNQVLQGRSDAVLHAEFSPDDKRIVTAGRDHKARVWKLADGTNEEFVEGHSFLVSQAAFVPTPAALAEAHPQGRIATVGIDDTARIWDIARGTEVRPHAEPMKPAGRAGAMSVSHDGTMMLTGDDKQGAILWDIETGTKRFSLANQRDEIVWTAFSPDDSLLFTGDAGGRCKLWSRKDDGAFLRDVSKHSDRITGAFFTSDGRLLLTASLDNSVEQWDLVAGRLLPGRTLKHPQAVTSLAVTADGRIAVTGCNDGKVRIWNVESAAIEQELDADSPQMVSLSHDGRRIVSTDSISRKVRVIELETVRTFAARNDRNLRLGEISPLLDLEERGYLAWCAMYSADDSRLLTVGGDGAKLWGVAKGDELQSFNPQGAVASVDFAPDGKHFVTGSWDRSVKIWNTTTGKAVQRLADADMENVNSVRYSPDGKWVVTASDDGAARLWDVATGVKQPTTFAHKGPLYGAEFSPDGTRLVTCGEDLTARVWNIADGKQLLVLEGHSRAVRAVAFSPDEQWIATGSDDNTAIIWNAATGAQVEVLEGHTAGVSSVAFTDDSERVLTGSQDNLAKLWDSKKGKEILTLKEHKQEVSSTAFSHDGLNALTSGRDGAAVLWPAIDWRVKKSDVLTPTTEARTSQAGTRQ